MPMHPQVRTHLDRLAAANFAELHAVPIERARAGMRAMAAHLGEPQPVAEVLDRVISTAAGELPVRTYHPEPGALLPATVFFHGGGFVLGDLDTHDGLARSLAAESGSVVVSVDYPLAPEHKYPAAPDAALAATAWVARHGAELGVDPARIAVAGDSAGGNLAAEVALGARDRSELELAFQLLIYPDLDFRRTNESIRQFAGKYGNISRETQFWFMDNYLASAEQRTLAGVSPLLAPDLAGLPPALIITAEYDALRDEGEQYAARLAAAGVPVTLRRYDGMIHEFVRHPFDDSRRALADAGRALRDALSVRPQVAEAGSA